MQRILCHFNYFVENLLVFCKSSLFSKTEMFCHYLYFFIVSFDAALYFDIISLGIYKSPCRFLAIY